MANLARSRIRSAARERRRIALFWSQGTDQAAVSDMPAVIDVQRALRALPFRKRACVVLRHAFGLSERETAHEGRPAVFELKDGAVLKNVVIGAPAADGVHCLGSCTLENVWWEDVGEDAATFEGTSPGATYTVTGGGARGADDKVFQFNGAGRLAISGFQVSDFGKLVRQLLDAASAHDPRPGRGRDRTW